MKLSDILKDVAFRDIIGDVDKEITNLCFDSRRADGESLFFALPGTNVDGHDYMAEATEKGATAAVCERLPEKPCDNVCYILVETSNEALAYAASTFYGKPSEKLKLVGATGTNGKTTTVSLLYELFRRLGYKSGLISTIAVYIDGATYPTTHTTPDSVQINKYLAQMVEQGCEYCFMEVSSHSIVQKRISGLNFAGGTFSNITHDHLDYHRTFDEYIKAKKGFFDMLPKTAFALTNVDDRNGKRMVQNTKAKIKTYASASPADFMCRVSENSFEGMLLQIDGSEVWTRFTGRFNACNLAAVYGTAVLLGADKTEVLRIISDLKPVSGRFESIRLSSGVTAIVDYAHTPDALQNVVDAVNEVRSGKSQLIIVVGCGGNRDKTKRPEMAKIAARFGDKSIMTSDNPRFEKPEDIIDDMKAGLDEILSAKSISVVDRREAIKTALRSAVKGDIILIAGKGHEDYQEIQGVKYRFDDKEVVIELSENK